LIPVIYGDVVKPTLGGASHVMVRIHAASINPVDYRMRSGLTRIVLNYALPLILGHDVSGTVVQAGEQVQKFKVGDEGLYYNSARTTKPLAIFTRSPSHLNLSQPKLYVTVFGRVPDFHIGTLAEYISVHESALEKKPTTISHEEAAAVPLVGLTAMQALKIANVYQGNKVFIPAGGM
jgi:NADPH:quinone reductase-like Zn-dependent oxidoreductase